MNVAEVMTKNPVCIDANDVVTKARSIMRECGFRALPVLEDGKLVGIISRGDVLRVTSRKTNIKVKGLMSENVVTASPDDDLFYAARKMISSGIRQLIVVKNDKLFGIITAKDILRKFVENDYTPVKKKVGDVMTRDVVYCEQDDEISKIWDKMYSSGYSGLPVVKDGKVIGMITRMDIIRDSSVMLSKESGKIRNVHVRKVKKTPAITTTPTENIKNVAEIMIERSISRLPVVNSSDRLLGIVDIEDILRAYVS